MKEKIIDIKDIMKKIDIDDLKSNPIHAYLFQYNSILKSISYSVKNIAGKPVNLNSGETTYSEINKLKKKIREGNEVPYLPELSYWRAAMQLLKLQEQLLGLKDEIIKAATNTIGNVYLYLMENKDFFPKVADKIKNEKKEVSKPGKDFRELPEESLEDVDDLLEED
ncbi:MAG: hypothetical protein J7K29_03055 [Candidatus Cloacimonetes bacterium]|nr:hypothetical protein [Candidatus Cloacimonadota bacterium]